MSCEAEVALDAVYRFDWPHPLGVFSEKDALAGILAANRRTRWARHADPSRVPVILRRKGFGETENGNPKALPVPLPYRPERMWEIFPTGKQPEKWWMHRSGNPSYRTNRDDIDTSMRLNSCASRQVFSAFQLFSEIPRPSAPAAE